MKKTITCGEAIVALAKRGIAVDSAEDAIQMALDAKFPTKGDKYTGPWKKPEEVKCHAKDPSNCRFHHTGIYAKAKNKDLFDVEKFGAYSAADINAFLEEQFEAAGIDAYISVTMDAKSGKFHVILDNLLAKNHGDFKDADKAKQMVENFIFDIDGVSIGKNGKDTVDSMWSEMGKSEFVGEFSTPESEDLVDDGEGDDSEAASALNDDVIEKDGGGFTDDDNKAKDIIADAIEAAGGKYEDPEWGKYDTGELTLGAKDSFQVGEGEIEKALKEHGFPNASVTYYGDDDLWEITLGEQDAAATGEKAQGGGKEDDFGHYVPENEANMATADVVQQTAENICGDLHPEVTVDGCEETKPGVYQISISEYATDDVPGELADELQKALNSPDDQGWVCKDMGNGVIEVGPKDKMGGGTGAEGVAGGQKSPADLDEDDIPSSKQLDMAYLLIGNLQNGHETPESASAQLKNILGVDVDLSGKSDDELETIAELLNDTKESVDDQDGDALGYFKDAAEKMAPADGKGATEGEKGEALTADQADNLEAAVGGVGADWFMLKYDPESKTYMVHDTDANKDISIMDALEKICETIESKDWHEADQEAKDKLNAILSEHGFQELTDAIVDGGGDDGEGSGAEGKGAKGSQKGSGSATAAAQASEPTGSGSKFAASGKEAAQQVGELHALMSAATEFGGADSSMKNDVEELDSQLEYMDHLQQQVAKASSPKLATKYQKLLDGAVEEADSLKHDLEQKVAAAKTKTIETAEETFNSSKNAVYNYGLASGEQKFQTSASLWKHLMDHTGGSAEAGSISSLEEYDPSQVEQMNGMLDKAFEAEKEYSSAVNDYAVLSVAGTKDAKAMKDAAAKAKSAAEAYVKALGEMKEASGKAYAALKEKKAIKEAGEIGVPEEKYAKWKSALNDTGNSEMTVNVTNTPGMADGQFVVKKGADGTVTVHKAEATPQAGGGGSAAAGAAKPAAGAAPGYSHGSASKEQKAQAAVSALAAKAAEAKDPQMKAVYEKMLAKLKEHHGIKDTASAPSQSGGTKQGGLKPVPSHVKGKLTQALQAYNISKQADGYHLQTPNPGSKADLAVKANQSLAGTGWFVKEGSDGLVLTYAEGAKSGGAQGAAAGTSPAGSGKSASTPKLKGKDKIPAEGSAVFDWVAALPKAQSGFKHYDHAAANKLQEATKGVSKHLASLVPSGAYNSHCSILKELTDLYQELGGNDAVSNETTPEQIGPNFAKFVNMSHKTLAALKDCIKYAKDYMKNGGDAAMEGYKNSAKDALEAFYSAGEYPKLKEAAYDEVQSYKGASNGGGTASVESTSGHSNEALGGVAAAYKQLPDFKDVSEADMLNAVKYALNKHPGAADKNSGAVSLMMAETLGKSMLDFLGKGK